MFYTTHTSCCIYAFFYTTLILSTLQPKRIDNSSVQQQILTFSPVTQAELQLSDEVDHQLYVRSYSMLQMCHLSFQEFTPPLKMNNNLFFL